LIQYYRTLSFKSLYLSFSLIILIVVLPLLLLLIYYCCYYYYLLFFLILLSCSPLVSDPIQGLGLQWVGLHILYSIMQETFSEDVTNDPRRAIFWSSVMLIFPGVLSMCFSMPFLTTYSKCPDNNRHCYCFQFSISRSYIWTISLLLLYWYISVGGNCHIYQHACLFLLIFDNDVRFIRFDRFIGVC